MLGGCLRIPDSHIPDELRTEIVKTALDNAMGIGGLRGVLGIGKSADWRGDFMKSLDGEVVVIHSILSGYPHYLNTPLHERLIRHGIVKKS